MEAVAALIPSPGLPSPSDLYERAAEARRRATERAAEALRPPATRDVNGDTTDDDGVILGELLSGSGSGQNSADRDRDSLLLGTPALRSALANGGLANPNQALQSYEEQRQAGYVQQLRQSTVIDLYV